MTHSNSKTKRKSGRARKRVKEEKALAGEKLDASTTPEEVHACLETTPEEIMAVEISSERSSEAAHFLDEEVVLPTPTEPPTQLEPIIVDPGNGPRVQDIPRFLNSPFADPICYEDERCADLAQPEVLPILFKLLPLEMAMMVYYNATRTFGRICPACRRVYRVGDQLAAHLVDGTDKMHEGPQTRREQMISGLCSWMCFAIASYPYPGSVGAWGKRGEELDPGIIAYLNGPGDPRVKNDEGFGQLLRMTRNEWLGIDPWRQPMLAYMAGLAGDPLPPYMPQ